MSKTRKAPTSQEQKAQLKKLRDTGLYKPKNPRKAPTKYAKSLLKRFADVLSGSSKAVTADYKTARKYSDKTAKTGEVRSKGNKVIVPVLPGEKVTVSKRKHEVEVYRKLETGQKYVRVPFEKRPKSYDQLRDQLGSRDRIAVPYYRGVRKPVEWQYFDSTEFYNTFVGGYGVANQAAQDKALKWALERAQISRYVEAGEEKRERDREYRERKRQSKAGGKSKAK